MLSHWCSSQWYAQPLAIDQGEVICLYFCCPTNYEQWQLSLAQKPMVIFSSYCHNFSRISGRTVTKSEVNVNEWQNHVWSLLLHKFKENTPKIEKMFEHFILQPYHLPGSYAHRLFINILDSGRGQVLFLMMIWRLSTYFEWQPKESINIIQ